MSEAAATRDPIGEPRAAIARARRDAPTPADLADRLTAAARQEHDVGATESKRLRDHRLVRGVLRPHPERDDEHPGTVRAWPSCRETLSPSSPEVSQPAGMAIPRSIELAVAAVRHETVDRPSLARQRAPDAHQPSAEVVGVCRAERDHVRAKSSLPNGTRATSVTAPAASNSAASGASSPSDPEAGGRRLYTGRDHG